MGVFRVCLASCFLAATLFAQVQSGRIEGTVQDSSNAVVPGAKLSIVNDRTHVKVEAEADGQGYFVFPVLQAGLYTLTAEATGFRKATVADRKSTRLNSSHIQKSRMPSSA